MTKLVGFRRKGIFAESFAYIFEGEGEGEGEGGAV